MVHVFEHWTKANTWTNQARPETFGGPGQNMTLKASSFHLLVEYAPPGKF